MLFNILEEKEIGNLFEKYLEYLLVYGDYDTQSISYQRFWHLPTHIINILSVENGHI